MTSQVVPLQQYNTIKNICRNIKAVFFKLGTRNVYHRKMTPVVPLPWPAVAMATVMVLVLI